MFEDKFFLTSSLGCHEFRLTNDYKELLLTTFETRVVFEAVGVAEECVSSLKPKHHNQI